MEDSCSRFGGGCLNERRLGGRRPNLRELGAKSRQWCPTHRQRRKIGCGAQRLGTSEIRDREFVGRARRRRRARGERERLEERHTAARTAIAPLRQRLNHDPAHTLGDAVRQGARTLRQVTLRPLPGRIRLEGELPGEHLVGNHPERIHVTPSIEGFGGELFGAHVRRGPEHRALLS